MTSSILNTIVEHTRQQVELDKKYYPLDEFRHAIKKSKRNYLQSLKQKKTSLIAEIKPKSPSKGLLKKVIDIDNIVSVFNNHAQCISVLTESKYFGGSLELLKNVAKKSKIPVLRKDFIIDEYQIYQARYFHADAVLLITSILSVSELQRFITIAESLGMACQVEIHDETDLEKVLQTTASIIGINNRNLKTMEIDLNTTKRLSKKIPSDIYIISESGIYTHTDILAVSQYAHAVHIGSAFMTSSNISSTIMKIMEGK